MWHITTEAGEGNEVEAAVEKEAEPATLEEAVEEIEEEAAVEAEAEPATLEEVVEEIEEEVAAEEEEEEVIIFSVLCLICVIKQPECIWRMKFSWMNLFEN